MKFQRASAVVSTLLLLGAVTFAGGPLYVAGTAFPATVQGHALVWDNSQPISYRTAPAGGLGKLSNAQAVQRVQQLFAVWQSVPTANIIYQNAGPIKPTGAYKGGAVSTAQQFSDIDKSCSNGVQSPIIFDSNGSLFNALGFGSDVIGFAGACAADANGHIIAAEAALNGIFIDGNQANGELNDNQFNQAFIHEFGHFSGLDHSQINVDVLNENPGNCNPMLLAALPIMFPIAQCQARVDAGLSALSPDDMAWISMLYPQTANNPSAGQVPFNSKYGIISGKVTFGDGITALQDANLIAHDVNQPQASQFSVVSGYLFTGDFGQSVSGDNPGDGGFGGHDPSLIGTFDIPVLAGAYNLGAESINPGFADGSSVGPLSFPIFVPANVSSHVSVSVSAGAHVTGIILKSQDSFPRFDQFEPQ